MKFSVEKIQSNLATLEIEVEEQRVEEALDQSYRKIVKQVNIPGFRKGKVPRPILEAQLGRGVLYQEALDILLNQTYSEALKESALEVVGEPKVEVVQMDRDMPLIYKVTVSIKPEIVLPDFSEIEVEDELPQEPTDEDVQKVLHNYQQRMARLENVESGTVEKGNIVLIDFVGYLDGVPFEGGAAQDYSLEIGSQTFIPGFEDQMVGMQLNEERDIEVTFPEEYPRSDLAGKPATFKVKVKEIKQRVYPEIDDELAKDVSEFETLAELKEEIRQNLREKAEKDAKRNMREKVVEKVVAPIEVDVPEPMVEERLKDMVTKFAQQISIQGTTLEQYLKMTNKSMKELVDFFRPQAETWAKSTLVLEAIAKKENITVTDQDVEDRITRTSEEFGMKREDVSESVNGVLESFKKEILLDKVVNYLMTTVKIVPPTADSAPENA
ncbi:MAG: trigger factor [Syntrophomonadaceae bacterium]|nr:trigger factor [Syntrophomonadaceae bacterium]